MRLLVVQGVGIALSATCALCSGCATSGYIKDRMRDGADVFTASVGKGIGAKARIGPVQAGLIKVSDVAGLRGGRLFRYDRYGGGGDLCIAIAGIEDFSCQGRAPELRPKEFVTTYCIVPLPLAFKGGPKMNASYWTQIEAVVGVGGTLRLGFNPGELFDFVLGWARIDLYGDDTEEKTETRSNQAAES